MPLRCEDQAGRNYHSFDLLKDEWIILAQSNRTNRHLRMPCCGSQVILRTSRLGTQHFAHKVIGDCTSPRESEAHLQLKTIAVKVARSQGWDAATEVAGVGPDGVPWRADVLAKKATAHVAIEIQLSSQTDEETNYRQERYRQSGVRCLWLMKQKHFVASEEIPAVRMEQNGPKEFTAVLSSGVSEKRIEVSEFLKAVFCGRFKFGIPLGANANVKIKAGHLICWHRSCRKRTRIVTGIEVSFGPNVSRFSIPQLGVYPTLIRTLSAHLSTLQGVGKIKFRHSRTQERGYLSNGCVHCGRIVGENFEHLAYGDEDSVKEFSVKIESVWKEAIRSRADCWWCYPETMRR